MAQLAELAFTASSWSVEQRREVLALLDRAVDGLTAVRATVLVAERESGAWQGAGYRSFEAWRERSAGASRRTAATQVRQADHLSAVPSVAAAVTEGRIGLEHAQAVAKVAATGTPAQRDAALSPAGQAELLGLATGLSAGQFALTVKRWAATVGPDGLERDHENQRAQRFLTVSATPHGTFVKGRLDSMAGHRLTLALEALSPRPAADDDRDPGQRRADALDAMAGRILALADTKPGGHVPPHVSMILTAETWAAARAERARRRGTRTQDHDEGGGGDDAGGGNAAGTSAGGDADGHRPESVATGYAPATLEDGTPVPASVLVAALCDCEITRIGIDADGALVDLGRTERVYTGAQRRAVIARDRECGWPGCHAHARWCEIHHILWWQRDAGPTSVDNGVLLCSFHHHEVHRRDLVVTRTTVAGRAGAPPGGEEPGRDPSPVEVARVAYEFRDRTGRVVAAPTTAAVHAGDGAAEDAGGDAPDRVRRRRALARAPERGSIGDVTAGTPSERVLPRPRASGEDARPGPGAYGQTSGGDDGATAGARPGAMTGSADEVDLTWTTDPFTGVRVPGFLLAE